MQIRKIKTEKTAKYVVLGSLNSEAKIVWIVLHGYGQLAADFILSFKGMESNSIAFVAPEALNRFYWKGFYGKVVASWMTKEERLDEINDYVKFLTSVYKEIKMACSNAQIKVLGFSQGSATACRWLNSTQTIVSELILWGAVWPHDMNPEEERNLFEKVKTTICIGDKDEWINSEKQDAFKAMISDKKLNVQLMIYPGTHDISIAVFKELTGES